MDKVVTSMEKYQLTEVWLLLKIYFITSSQKFYYDNNSCDSVGETVI